MCIERELKPEAKEHIMCLRNPVDMNSDTGVTRGCHCIRLAAFFKYHGTLRPRLRLRPSRAEFDGAGAVTMPIGAFRVHATGNHLEKADYLRALAKTVAKNTC